MMVQVKEYDGSRERMRIDGLHIAFIMKNNDSGSV